MNCPGCSRWDCIQLKYTKSSMTRRRYPLKAFSAESLCTEATPRLLMSPHTRPMHALISQVLIAYTIECQTTNSNV